MINILFCQYEYIVQKLWSKKPKKIFMHWHGWLLQAYVVALYIQGVYMYIYIYIYIYIYRSCMGVYNLILQKLIVYPTYKYTYVRTLHWIIEYCKPQAKSNCCVWTIYTDHGILWSDNQRNANDNRDTDSKMARLTIYNRINAAAGTTYTLFTLGVCIFCLSFIICQVSFSYNRLDS